jgi:predicted metalloprotease with PDZ domain
MIKKTISLSKHLSQNPYRLLLLIVLVLNICSLLYADSAVADSTRNDSGDLPKAEPKAGLNAVDSDGDGLSDFQEVHKYLTDPTKKDTDGDSIPDGDWNERREYTYSVRTILKFMPPFDKSALNDNYQDARVLEETDDYIKLEVIHYPLATPYESIEENPNWQRDYAGMTEYLKPGVTTNWDAKMKHDLLTELRADGILIDKLTDKQVVERVSSWLMKRSRSLDKVFTTYYVHFPNGQPSVYPGLEGAFEHEFDRDKENYDWTMDQHFDHELLGKGMFYNKTHGSCTSFAIYLTTVLRALGIPTRMILVVPAVDPSDRAQFMLVNKHITHNKVREIMLSGFRRALYGFTAHTFNEVYVGNRWRRLNYNKLGQPILDQHLFGLHTHLYTFNDLSEADLTRTWGWRYGKDERNGVFKYGNPYSAVELSDHFGCHSNLANPPFTAENLSTSPLPNIFILEPDRRESDFSIWDEVTARVEQTTYNRTGRQHQKECYDDIFNGVFTKKPGDVIVLLFSLDTKERIPEDYKDLLPKPWPEIEADLQKGKTVELEGKARDSNIILLAAPKREQLRQLIRDTKLLGLEKAGQIEGRAAEKIEPSPGSALPNIYVMSPSGFDMFREIFEMVRQVTYNKTGRPHDKKSYDSIFIEGIWGKKPGDIVVLLFSLDKDDRIPAEYEDLLPVAWSAIESALKQEKTLELRSVAREMNVILLAAPTSEKLRRLVEESSLLKAIGGNDKKPDAPSPGEKWTLTGRTKGPVAYTVTIASNNWRKAVVNCRIVTDGDLSLWMNNNGAPRVSDGHASFVRNLTAIDSAGNTLHIKNFGEARWMVSPTENQPVTLSYEVLLEHDKSDLPWGRDEAPYVTEDGAFWTGRALFIVAEMNNVTLRFDLPDQWHVSTPWQPAPDKTSAFSLKDQDELTEAFIFTGTHIEEQARIGDMEIALALGTKMKPSGELLKTASQNLLNCCVELFGGTVPGRTLIVVNRQEREHSFDGGVFGRSVSMLMGDEPNKQNIEQWVPFIAHELFHLWNGQFIGHTGNENWFSEGFTDYYAMVVCVRSNLISEEEFIQRLRSASERYFIKSGQKPIREAHDYELQYAGGSLVGASLDILIRKSTDNMKSLDDLMRCMYQEFGKTGKKYSIEDVIRIANEITRADHTEFFKRYVEGTDVLPLEEYFGCMGLDLRRKIKEELPDGNFAIHEMLHIMSLSQMHEGLLIRRSQEAGYQDEDYLTAIDGTPVKSFTDIQTVTKRLTPGDTIDVILLRGGKEITMKITLGGEGQKVPFERKVEVGVDKKAKLDSRQKAILSGITGQQQDERMGNK